MYDPNTRVSHELNRIGYLGRSFTLDNPNLLTWARNLKHSKSQFRRQVTSYYNTLYKNNEDPDLPSTTEALKSHYDFLDTAVTNLINSRKTNLFYDRFAYVRQMNHSSAIKTNLRTLKENDITLAQLDKNMGDVVIRRDVLDKVCMRHFRNGNYVQIHRAEHHVSKEIRFNVVKLKDKYEAFLGPDWPISPDFLSLKYVLIAESKSKDFKSLPKLRPIFKAHKSYEDWRMITNPGDFYTKMHSKALQAECHGITHLLMEKHKAEVILENTADYINNLKQINDPHYGDDTFRISIDLDVKALYDSMDLDQCITIITKTIELDLPSYNHWRVKHITDIITFFKNNTVTKWTLISGRTVIFKMISGIGTGYSHSSGLANLTLFCFEIQNDHAMRIAIDYGTKILFQMFKRYIDDIRTIVDLDLKQFVNKHGKQDKNLALLFIKRTVVPALNQVYPKNLALDAKFGTQGIFLDTSSNIQNGRIHTKLYEKPLNKHITLLFTSNNPKNQKSSTIISQLYRSIIINDRKADHNAYRKKLIQRQRNRGYPAKVLRHILRKKNIPKYSHRDTYLKKQLFKHKQRYYKTILQYQQHITDYTEWPIGDRAMEEIKLKYKLNDAEDDSQPKQIWFKLSFEQLFDDENEIRQLLNECHRRLPAYFQDEIELNLSVKLPNKVGRYLN
eukprot:994306_1